MLNDNKSIIEIATLLMPVLKDFFVGDVAICVANLENYVYYKAGKDIDHKIKPGDPFISGGVVEQCFRAKKTIVSITEAKVFGFPCSIMAAPIYNSKKEIIGAICISESAEMQRSRLQFKDIADEISNNMGVLVQYIDSLKNQSEYISNVTNNLKQTTEKSKEQVQETNDMLNLIKNIAYKTNLLGINAAIEATRAGAEGAGFKVVSDEIRKLSINTGDSVKKIEPIIKQVHSNSNTVAEKIVEINTSNNSMTELINKTLNMTKAIGEFSKNIDMLADNLLKSSKK
ncbi:MAG: methyl-accepting chemotaxis protein [Candidatus Gastranaerophilales bacterium]|nr:methyl-accepting chemotaxis protein [Candidatus Gastranaerophilales bacterium]